MPQNTINRHRTNSDAPCGTSKTPITIWRKCQNQRKRDSAHPTLYSLENLLRRVLLWLRLSLFRVRPTSIKPRIWEVQRFCLKLWKTGCMSTWMISTRKRLRLFSRSTFTIGASELTLTLITGMLYTWGRPTASLEELLVTCSPQKRKLRKLCHKLGSNSQKSKLNGFRQDWWVLRNAKTCGPKRMSTISPSRNNMQMSQ